MDKVKNPRCSWSWSVRFSAVLFPAAQCAGFGGHRQATAPCPGAIDEIREKQSICNIS